MAKKEAPKIMTERLILRPMAEQDIPSMLRMFNDDEVREFLGGHPPRDKHSMLKSVRGRQETQWAVMLKGSDEYIGEVHVPNIVEGYLGEIGYLFLREYWGSGYAQEAVHAMIEHCKNALQLKRLYAHVDDRNVRSKKLLEKLGFQLIAVLPEADMGGRVADIAYYTRVIS